MDAWLPIILVAVTQIALRLITVVGVVWRERARAEAHRVEMEAAAASGATLCERHGDGTALLIIPRQKAEKPEKLVDPAVAVPQEPAGEKVPL